MKKYPIRVIRSVAYEETLDMIVVAKTSDDAERIASEFAEKGPPEWPGIQAYTVVNRKEETANVLDIQHGEGDA